MKANVFFINHSELFIKLGFGQKRPVSVQLSDHYSSFPIVELQFVFAPSLLLNLTFNSCRHVHVQTFCFILVIALLTDPLRDVRLELIYQRQES